MMDWAANADDTAPAIADTTANVNPASNSTDDVSKAVTDPSLYADRQQYAHPSFESYSAFHPGPNYSDVPAPAFTPHARHYGQPLGHSNPAAFTTNAFANYSQQQAFPQYRRSPYDPTLVNPATTSSNFDLGLNFPAQSTSAATIVPHALEHEQKPQSYGTSPLHVYPQNNAAQPRAVRPEHLGQNHSASHMVDQMALARTIPPGSDAGIFAIINFDSLARATNSERLDNFLNVGKELLEWDCTRSAIPTYTVRKSRNQLRALAGTNPNLLSKIGKKAPRDRSSIQTLKIDRPAVTSVLGQSQHSPAQRTEESSEEESSSSSEDDSEYSSDDDSDSPLPSKRPEDSRGAVEYDTIKSLWRSKRKAVDGPTIRKGLVEFWEIIKTIRDRWKNDAAAVSEAQEKKRVNELPLLKSRVKDQRDMIEVAFRTAYKHGHRAIIELMAENVALVFLCYQFLLDRMKNDDINGPLSRSILEIMSVFTTLTAEKLEKTHLVKVLRSSLGSQKKADAKTRSWVKRILANAEEASKDATSAKFPASEQKQTLPAESTESKPSPATKKTAPESVVGVKRAASSTEEANAPKRTALETNKAGVAGAGSKASSNGMVKKVSAGSDGAKTAAQGGAASTVARKTVVAKPSGFFSSLQSASKRPGTSIAEKSASNANGKATIGKTASGAGASAPVKPAFSFAETMANLSKPKEEKPAPKAEKETPAETSEQRAKRLRKEQRRKLHVSFRTGEDLVQIRYFTHDPQEEIDHDSSQKRDVGDVGGEGRMFKQQSHNMDLDDDDDTTDEPEDLRSFKSPNLIDFGEVDADERQRNFAPYGGGEAQVDSQERAAREQYENSTLLVFYTDPNEIPPNPREPADLETGEQLGDLQEFGKPETKFITRAQEKSKQLTEKRANFMQTIDLNAIANIVTQQAQQQQPPPPPQPQVAAPIPNLQAILAQLQKSNPNQPSYPTNPAPAPVPFYAPPAPSVAPIPASNGYPAPTSLEGIDLAAILASVSSQAPGQSNTNYNNPQMSKGHFSSAQQNGYSDYNNGDRKQNSSQFMGQQYDADIPSKHPMYKTKPCKFWQDGRCTKGSECGYLHEEPH